MQAELPTSTELQAIKNLKQIAREEFILPGTSICGGCGGLEALRLAAKVLGPKTVFVNARVSVDDDALHGHFCMLHPIDHNPRALA